MKHRIRSVFMMNDDGDVSMTADQVIAEDGDGSRDTGLLDAKGNPVYRLKQPIGFAIRRTPR